MNHSDSDQSNIKDDDVYKTEKSCHFYHVETAKKKIYLYLGGERNI